ncbi:creatininase family protein [Halococcus saccharolyticus]|uniref:Creatininase n=1 Tax=Halococcus saccharolyticus DSM 5350 TaxID=1227455 RepID=M0MIA0_9EURY|nr:creatininase family protein [Halococcus saccharolyticus]EMA44165.1 creatininase [Halococcus saccharolyticus DSM 5350]
MQLTEATWTDADATETDLALLPVGSTEQHGPHAPLGTDRLTARAVAAAGAERYEEVHGSEVVVAPTIPVGIAEEHHQFAGTLWVAPDTLRSYVRETVASLASHGWDRVVLVNGHGGNVDALREVCGAITRHDAAYAVPFTWFEAAASLSEMGHGGPIETALLRAIHPDLVRENRIEEAQAGASETWGEWVSGTNLAFDAAEFTDNGVVGDPGDGSAERGEELLEDATAALVTLLDAIEDRDGSRQMRE